MREIVCESAYLSALLKLFVFEILLNRVATVALGISQVAMLCWMLETMEEDLHDVIDGVYFSFVTFLIAVAVLIGLTAPILLLLPRRISDQALSGEDTSLLTNQRLSLAAGMPIDDVLTEESSVGIRREPRRRPLRRPGSQRWFNGTPEASSGSNDSTSVSSGLGPWWERVRTLGGRLSPPKPAATPSATPSATRGVGGEGHDDVVPPTPSAMKEFAEKMREYGGTPLMMRYIARKLEGFTAMQSSRIIARATLISRSIVEVVWALLFLYYAEVYAERSVCIFNRPCAAVCDRWLVGSVPRWLLACEAVFLWAATIEFLLDCLKSATFAELLTAERCLKLTQLPIGILAWRSLVLPGLQQELRVWGGSAAPPTHVSLQLGWLHVAQPILSKAIERMVRTLVRTPSEVTFATTVSRACCVVALYAGLMQWLIGASIRCTPSLALPPDDAPFTSARFNCSTWSELFADRDVSLLTVLNAHPDEYDCDTGSFLSYWDYLYYSIVTASTVGFGDFSPPETVSRLVTALYVIAIVAYIPVAVSEAMEVYGQKRDYCVGVPPSPWRPFVLLVGPVSPAQLSMFMQEFCSLRGSSESYTQFVVLSPLELRLYHQLVSATSPNHRRRLYIQHGDVVSSMGAIRADSLPVDVRDAKAIFLFSSTLDDRVDDHLREDSATLVRTLVLRKLLSDSLMSRISLQLNHAREKRLALDLGVNAAIALDELKMGLLALSCTRTFGLTTLLTNLLYTLPYEISEREDEPWRSEYIFGASHESYQIMLPACCAPYRWREVVGAIFSALGITIVARVRATPIQKERSSNGGSSFGANTGTDLSAPPEEIDISEAERSRRRASRAKMRGMLALHLSSRFSSRFSSRRNLAAHASTPRLHRLGLPSGMHSTSSSLGSIADEAAPPEMARDCASRPEMARDHPPIRLPASSAASSEVEISGAEVEISGTEIEISGAEVEISGAKESLGATLGGSLARISGHAVDEGIPSPAPPTPAPASCGVHEGGVHEAGEHEGSEHKGGASSEPQPRSLRSSAVKAAKLTGDDPPIRSVSSPATLRPGETRTGLGDTPVEREASMRMEVDWWLDLDPWKKEDDGGAAAQPVGDSCIVLALACSQTHLDMVHHLSPEAMKASVDEYNRAVATVQSAPYEGVHQQWQDRIKRERAREYKRFESFKRWRRVSRDAARPSVPSKPDLPLPGHSQPDQSRAAADDTAAGTGSASGPVGAPGGSADAGPGAGSSGLPSSVPSGVPSSGATSSGVPSGPLAASPSSSVLVGSCRSIGGRVAERRFVLCVCPSWPSEIEVFLTGTLGTGEFAVVLLCQHEPSSAQLEVLRSYVDETGRPLVRVVLGDPLERRVLSRAGIGFAHSIVIFASGRGALAGDLATLDDGDRRSTLIRAKIAEMQMSSRSAQRAPVITEVHSARAVRFVDPTLWWPDDEDDDFSYVRAPAYASGHVFSPAMLHPLVGYTYFMPLLMPLLQQLCYVSDHMHIDEATLSPETGREGIQLWLVPSLFHGHRFDELFVAMQTHGITAIGLLRCPAPNEPAPSSHAEPASTARPSHPYVFALPMQGTVLSSGDRVYVILPEACTAAVDELRGSRRRPSSTQGLFSNISNRTSTMEILAGSAAAAQLSPRAHSPSVPTWRKSVCPGAMTAAAMRVSSPPVLQRLSSSSSELASFPRELSQIETEEEDEISASSTD